MKYQILKRNETSKSEDRPEKSKNFLAIVYFDPFQRLRSRSLIGLKYFYSKVFAVLPFSKIRQ